MNPQVAGNGGGIEATVQSNHGLPASAEITIPANRLLVFAPHRGRVGGSDNAPPQTPGKRTPAPRLRLPAPP